MAVTSLEERVSALEAEVARLKERLTTNDSQRVVPWWEKIYGTFAESTEYEEAMRLGRAYRESLRPRDDRTDEK